MRYALIKEDWRKNSRVAKFWTPTKNNRVECSLCPRHCKPGIGQMGFCQVRGNVAGELHTFNYGKSVAATEEVIETEAVNHYMPGARILSLGNVGCMLSCDFCQNWQTSQVKHLDPSVVKHYTPESIVKMALENNIEILSWTYNDPVVWHEFIYDTAKLARQEGIKNLYKSAFYIEQKPVEELLEVIDIFSLSLKSMDPEFYRKFTKGELQPMLDRTKQVYESGAHLEISQLLISGRNEGDEDIIKTVDWLLENTNEYIPLHFVGFHPAYKYLNVERTSKERLIKAREIALKRGVKFCYIGNVYEDGMANTCCPKCNSLLVERFGLTTTLKEIDSDGSCKKCGENSHIKFPFEGLNTKVQKEIDFKVLREREYLWDKEVKSAHLTLPENFHGNLNIRVRRVGTEDVDFHTLGSGNLSRVIISRSKDSEEGMHIQWDKDIDLLVMPVLDRAHFPIYEDVTKVR